jgi:hypothetical protein
MIGNDHLIQGVIGRHKSERLSDQNSYTKTVSMATFDSLCRIEALLEMLVEQSQVASASTPSTPASHGSSAKLPSLWEVELRWNGLDLIQGQRNLAEATQTKDRREGKERRVYLSEETTNGKQYVGETRLWANRRKSARRMSVRPTSEQQ